MFSKETAKGGGADLDSGAVLTKAPELVNSAKGAPPKPRAAVTQIPRA